MTRKSTRSKASHVRHIESPHHSLPRDAETSIIRTPRVSTPRQPRRDRSAHRSNRAEDCGTLTVTEPLEEGEITESYTEDEYEHPDPDIPETQQEDWNGPPEDDLLKNECWGWLEPVNRGLKRLVFEHKKPEYKIGRHPDCDHIIDGSKHISRFHCTVKVLEKTKEVPASVYIINNSSSLGIWVRNSAATTWKHTTALTRDAFIVLNDGDRVSLLRPNDGFNPEGFEYIFRYTADHMAVDDERDRSPTPTPTPPTPRWTPRWRPV